MKKEELQKYIVTVESGRRIGRETMNEGESSHFCKRWLIKEPPKNACGVKGTLTAPRELKLLIRGGFWGNMKQLEVDAEQLMSCQRGPGSCCRQELNDLTDRPSHGSPLHVV